MKLSEKLELSIEIIFGIINIAIIFLGSADAYNYLWLLLDASAIIFFVIRKMIENRIR